MQDITMNRKIGRYNMKSKRTILDLPTRRKRARHYIESLEKNNYQADPHADLKINKKAPKFEDSDGLKQKKKKKFHQRYRKDFQYLLEDEQFRMKDITPNYFTVAAPMSKRKPKSLCSVCGNFSGYTCVVCGLKFCCIKCQDMHKETRCLKWSG